MPAIDFPSGICQVSADIMLRTAGGVQVSPWNYATYPQDWGGDRWEFTLTFLPTRNANAISGQLDAFLLKIRGGRQPFRYGDPSRSLPRGVATGTPVVSGVATGGSTSLATTGWTASITNILRAGDYLQIGDHYYMALEDVDSDGSGNATLTLCPRLRANYANATPIIVQNPRGVFITNDPLTTFQRGIHRTQPTTLIAIESL